MPHQQLGAVHQDCGNDEAYLEIKQRLREAYEERARQDAKALAILEVRSLGVTWLSLLRYHRHRN